MYFECLVSLYSECVLTLVAAFIDDIHNFCFSMGMAYPAMVRSLFCFMIFLYDNDEFVKVWVSFISAVPKLWVVTPIVVNLQFAWGCLTICLGSSDLY